VTVVRRPKFAKAAGWRDVLFFRSGTLTGDALRKQGLDLAPYHAEKVKGRKTDLKWSCEHINSVGDRFAWQATAHARRQGPWKMEGTVTRTTPDGQIYKYLVRGSGRPYTPDTPEFTPSGK
jgi:hypothetical protein